MARPLPGQGSAPPRCQHFPPPSVVRSDSPDPSRRDYHERIAPCHRRNAKFAAPSLCLRLALLPAVSLVLLAEPCRQPRRTSIPRNRMAGASTTPVPVNGADLSAAQAAPSRSDAIKAPFTAKLPTMVAVRFAQQRANASAARSRKARITPEHSWYAVEHYLSLEHSPEQIAGLFGHQP